MQEVSFYPNKFFSTVTFHGFSIQTDNSKGIGGEIVESFEQIYNEYFPRVYRFLYRLCQNGNTAEELTQETFYQAFLSFGKYRGESELFTWLASIAKFTLYTAIRKHKLPESTIALDLLADTLIDTDDSPEETLQKKEAVEKIRKAILALPKKYADVVILRIYAELPFSEIAEVLKITENSAKVLFFRAKKMLAEELTDNR